MKDGEPATEQGESPAEGRSFLWVVLYAAPVSLIVLGLNYYWFAVADRYAIFLYGHLGATPFDERTRSRYWMSGLVACGIVLVLDLFVHWFLGRLAGIRFRRHAPPAWWQVWLVAAPLLALGIPAITLTVNQPTLRPSDAAACVVVTLAGLALALAPGRLAAQRPLELAWLAFAGLGLAPSLLLLRALELPSAGLAARHTAYLISGGSLLGGMLWLLLAVWIRGRQHWLQRAAHRLAPRLYDPPRPAPQPDPSAHTGTGTRSTRAGLLAESVKLLVSAFCLAYLLLPLAHHVYLTPAKYRYISASTNFFALNPGMQFASLLVCVVLAVGGTYLRLYRRSASKGRTL
jgi:hypothetical protein